MTKIILIDNCVQCCYCEEKEDNLFCINEDLIGKFDIPKKINSPLPKWCPLLNLEDCKGE